MELSNPDQHSFQKPFSSHDVSKPPICDSEAAQPSDKRPDAHAKPGSEIEACQATVKESSSDERPDSPQPRSTTRLRIQSGDVLQQEPAAHRDELPASSEDSPETSLNATTVNDGKPLLNLIQETEERDAETILKFVRNLNATTRKSPLPLAFLKVGLHAQATNKPLWAHALLDCGATDNFISLKTVQALPNFDKLVINTSTSSTIRTANNDQSQIIHGKVILFLSFVDELGQQICYRAPFLIVSGLVHDIFLGQPLVSSPQLSHQTAEHLYFHTLDQLVPTEQPLDFQGKQFHAVRKIYDIRRRLTTSKKITIPPKTAQKISTNLVEKIQQHSDIFYSAHPTQKFQRKYPSIHMMHQTVLPRSNSKVLLTVINTSDSAVTINANRSLAQLETHFKSDAFADDLSSFLPSDETNCTSGLRPSVSSKHSVMNLNSIVRDHNASQLAPEQECCQCNSAYASSSFHEHELTPQEREERNKQYRMEGFFQKSVSEVIENSSNFPSMNYEGENQFVAKTPEELLSECPLNHLSDKNRALVLKMLADNISAFQTHSLDIGECKGITAFAPLTTNDPPILYAKYRPIPLAYKEAAQKLIDQYVAAGVLAPTTEPCTFTSNIFIIPKKDGTFRLIFDGRVLSRFCKQLPLSLGSFDEIFSNLQGKTLVTKLDLSKAYDQLKVAPETSKLLSFFGPDNRRYKYLRAGQGLKFSSFFLNQAMEVILDGLPDVTSYCDDIFIATSGTFEEHLKLLETVIKRFAAYNVKLSIAKMEVCPETLDFLGLTWSRNKLSIPDSKIMAYQSMKKPTSLKEARFIVNSTAFYRRFIPNFSRIISPILDLLKNENAKKNFKKLWKKEHQQAIDELMASLKDGVSLYLPRKDEPFIIHSDASYVAAAATCSQYDENGELRLVAAVSRTFIKSERSLAPIHKEILSLLYALTSLNYILRGAHIKVFADARSITLLKTCSASSPYLARLAMELSVYDFELYHLPGQLNIVADALSRMGKTQEQILEEDKTKNNAMTKQESLEFLEFLTLPTDTRYTVSEVKHLLRSEPLRSELKARVATRLASNKRSHHDNAPNAMKSKKTHEPVYTKSHPLERRNGSSQKGSDRSRAHTRSRSRARSASRSRSSANQRGNRKNADRRSRTPTPSSAFVAQLRPTLAPTPSVIMIDQAKESTAEICENGCNSQIYAIEHGLILTRCTICAGEQIFHPVSIEDGVDGKSDSYSSESESEASTSDSESDDALDSETDNSTCDNDLNSELSDFMHNFQDGNAFIASELDDENGPENIPSIPCELHNCAVHNPDLPIISEPQTNDFGISEADLNTVLTDSDRFYEAQEMNVQSQKDTSYEFEIPPPFFPESEENSTLDDAGKTFLHSKLERLPLIDFESNSTSNDLPSEDLWPVTRRLVHTYNGESSDSEKELSVETERLEDPSLLVLDDSVKVCEEVVNDSFPLFELNHAAFLNAIIVDETLPDLALKSNIINDGQISTKLFVDAQNLDTRIAALKEEQEKRPNSIAIKIIDEVACKRVSGQYLPILPKCLEKMLLYSEHFHVTSGHKSAKSIIQSISDKFYMFDLKQKVNQFCKDCYICSVSKSQNMRKAKQGATVKAKEPREIMSFDIFGGLNTSEDGYKYVYSFVDNFSLYVTNVKAKTRSLTEILSAFLQVFAFWGRFPRIVCTDNETSLMTKEANDFFASFGIAHSPGASHAHWRLLSEGASIRKSKNYMRATLLSCPELDWTHCVQLGTVALNNTKTMYGFTPYELFYGTRNSAQELISVDTACRNLDEYFETVNKLRGEMIATVAAKRRESVKTRSDLINQHRESKVFEPNQLVWLKTLNISPNRSTKLKNLGPFRILEQVNPLTYKLARLSDPQKCVRISHATHLEPYRNSIDISSINFPNLNLK